MALLIFHYVLFLELSLCLSQNDSKAPAIEASHSYSGLSSKMARLHYEIIRISRNNSYYNEVPRMGTNASSVNFLAAIHNYRNHSLTSTANSRALNSSLYHGRENYLLNNSSLKNGRISKTLENSSAKNGRKFLLRILSSTKGQNLNLSLKNGQIFPSFGNPSFYKGRLNKLNPLSQLYGQRFQLSDNNRQINSTSTSNVFKNIRVKRQSKSTDFSALRKAIVECKQIGTVYLVNKYTQYEQGVQIAKAYQELSGLSFQINSLNPTRVGDYSVLRGISKNYLLSTQLFMGGLSTIPCVSLNADQIDLFTYNQEKLPVNVTIILADKLVWNDNRLLCTLHDTEYAGLACVQNIRI